MDMEKVEMLIEMVRGYIFLYDTGHHQYKNASLKSMTWDSIGRKLNESGETVRGKWKTVRDGYTKYKKQLKSSKGSSKKLINYTWAPQLAFLDTVNTPRALRNQTPAYDSDNSQERTSPPPLTPIAPQMPSSSQALPIESPSTAPALRISYRNNKRSSENENDDDDELGRVLQLINAKKKKECDVIDNLFLSYADTFKKFPPREQAIVKLELAKLFSNTELQLLNNNTNYTNFDYSAIKRDNDDANDSFI